MEILNMEKNSLLYISMKYYVDIQRTQTGKKSKPQFFDVTIKNLDDINNVDAVELLMKLSADIVKAIKPIQHSDVNWSFSKMYNKNRRVLAHFLLTEFTGEVTVPKRVVPTTGFFFNLLTKQSNYPYKVIIHGVPLVVMEPNSEYKLNLDKIQLFLTEPFQIEISNIESGSLSSLSFQYVKGAMKSMTVNEVADIAVPSGWFNQYKVKKKTRTKKTRKKL